MNGFFPKSACSLWLHTHNWWMDFFPRAHALSDFFKVTDNETISRQNFWPCCNVFTSSKKHEIRRFHVAVVHDGKETYKKACVHVQCCFFFSNLNLLHFSPSHCPRRCRCCLSCLLFRWPIDFRNQNYLFPLVPWDQVSIHYLWNEVEIGPRRISQWLLGQVKKLPIAERHAPRNDARNLPETIVGHFRF